MEFPLVTQQKRSGVKLLKRQFSFNRERMMTIA